MKTSCKVAVVQDSSVPFDAAATTQKTCRLIAEAAQNGAELVLFPEAFLGTYPKGLTFDAPIGRRQPEGRAEFLRYHQGAVDMNGEELRTICDCAAAHDIVVVLGMIERDGGTLYCTVAFIDPQHGLIGKHRKVMPTAAERLVWGFGDGSTLSVVDSRLGRIGAVICWENYMPALRLAMYGQGVEIYCAPTADDRDSWIASMQHIALEGRCYVLSACQFIRHGEYGDNYRSVLNHAPEEIAIRGGSTIISPMGEILVPPLYNEAAILYAELDGSVLTHSKFDFDPIGHYARPDIFSLHVDTAEKKPVRLDPQRH